MPAPGWQNPIVVPAGRTQNGVDPRRLLPSRADLLRVRLDLQRRLVRSGTPRLTPIQVTTDGIIFDGHHAVRAAADDGRSIDVKVVFFPLTEAADSILDLPVV